MTLASWHFSRFFSNGKEPFDWPVKKIHCNTALKIWIIELRQKTDQLTIIRHDRMMNIVTTHTHHQKTLKILNKHFCGGLSKKKAPFRCTYSIVHSKGGRWWWWWHRHNYPSAVLNLYPQARHCAIWHYCVWHTSPHHRWSHSVQRRPGVKRKVFSYIWHTTKKSQPALQE